MIRRRIVLAVVALALAAAPSAFALAAWTPVVASGKVASESRPVPAFTGIALSLPGKVEVVQGSPASVTVEADDNLLPEIETVVEGGKLRIRFHRDLNVVGQGHPAREGHGARASNRSPSRAAATSRRARIPAPPSPSRSAGRAT